MKVCDFCNKPTLPDVYIEVDEKVKCFECCQKDTREFVKNGCNCGICSSKVPCNELIRYPALDADICENCFNLLNEENERNNK